VVITVGEVCNIGDGNTVHFDELLVVSCRGISRVLRHQFIQLESQFELIGIGSAQLRERDIEGRGRDACATLTRSTNGSHVQPSAHPLEQPKGCNLANASSLGDSDDQGFCDWVDQRSPPKKLVMRETGEGAR
jgi:hypothetical protein